MATAGTQESVKIIFLHAGRATTYENLISACGRALKPSDNEKEKLQKTKKIRKRKPIPETLTLESRSHHRCCRRCHPCCLKPPLDPRGGRGGEASGSAREGEDHPSPCRRRLICGHGYQRGTGSTWEREEAPDPPLPSPPPEDPWSWGVER